ncbi:glycosyltransferase family 4 protein [Luteolibacter arcticus]|uniref:Glycosyltransferase family 4 protein n=1 Tax=Luteolibacter arcticus TaxID=1581411 RepID=A0ABT3GJ28_9BACT|nr:glycosyltransferase family 4 protein [Luteolibacter arcticus]MCW1923524.1 glycosyltransferase family 4 protein [Luteolibacter arcticus]
MESGSPKRIALCIECPLGQHGGVEVLVRALIEGLHSHFEVCLVSQDTPATLRPVPCHEGLSGHFQWNPADHSGEQIERLIAWAKAERIELLHFHHGGTYGWNSRSWSHCVITAASQAGLRCVSTNHGAFGFWLFVGAQRSLPYRLAAMCLCLPAKLRQVAAVEWEATVSKHDYHAVRRWFFPVRSRFRQIYHSILDDSVLPERSKRPIILCLGTVGSRKGQPFLADAFGRIADKHPEWRLVIAGRHASDSTPAELAAAVARHGIADRVDILTDVSDDLARQLIAEAAVFGMPSLAEGLGLSLQEALYGRAACVGSRVGGIPDLIIDEKTGLLVPPANPEALAAALDRVMSDPALRQRLGNAGRQHVIDHEMTRVGMVRKHRELYLRSPIRTSA